MNHNSGRTQPMLRRLWITCIVTAITVTVSTATASAQTKGQVDVLGGYLHLFDGYGALHGGTLQVSTGISPNWAVVLDAGGVYQQVRGLDSPEFYPGYRGDDYRRLKVAGLAGFRRVIGRRGKFSGFWQILGGTLQEKSFDRCVSYGRNQPCGPAEDYSESHFVIQHGLGVTVMVVPRFGVRGQVDAISYANDEGYPDGFLRAVAGGVIRLGKTR